LDETKIARSVGKTSPADNSEKNAQIIPILKWLFVRHRHLATLSPRRGENPKMFTSRRKLSLSGLAAVDRITVGCTKEQSERQSRSDTTLNPIAAQTTMQARAIRRRERPSSEARTEIADVE